MVFKPEPLERAFESLSKKMGVELTKAHKVFLDPKGFVWSQNRAQEWLDKDLKQEINLILLCGRYGGVDQRFLDVYVDESISLGRFILGGGELPALCVIESLIRLSSDVLGNPDSVAFDSFSQGLSGGLEPELFTRPQVWKGLRVPELLLSGDHGKIKREGLKRSLELSQNWFKQEMKELQKTFERVKKGTTNKP